MSETTVTPAEYEAATVEGPHGRPATIWYRSGPSSTFTFRLDEGAIDQIRQIAELHKVGPTQLVRAWVLERLHLETTGGAFARQVTSLPADSERLLREGAIQIYISKAAEFIDAVVAQFEEQIEREAQLLAESQEG